MSNNLAIVTVTATLKNLLQKPIKKIKEGAEVTTVALTPEGKDLPNKLGVNLFLYQVITAKLDNNHFKRETTKQSHTRLDLFYLLTFYGSHALHEPQKCMGTVISTLIDHPYLTSDMIRNAIAESTDEDFAYYDFAEQTQQINIIPIHPSLEELTKIWAPLGPIPYSACLVYKVTSIIIEGAAPGEMPLRVRRLLAEA